MAFKIDRSAYSPDIVSHLNCENPSTTCCQWVTKDWDRDIFAALRVYLCIVFDLE
jgi:hypothetical protein